MYALEHYEEIDDIYRSKQKKKLITFLIPAALTLIFAGVSLWGYVSSQNKLSDNYDYNLLTANTAAQTLQKPAEDANAETLKEYDDSVKEIVDQYYTAILTDPTRTEAYIGDSNYDGLVDLLLQDDKLTPSESGYLTKLRTGLSKKDSGGNISDFMVLDQLADANPDGYQDVCFEIGETLLFYYTIGVEKDKYSAAAVWFEKAKQKYPEAEMYCQISECLSNVDKYEKADQVAKLEETYNDLWSLVSRLNTSVADYDDDLKLRAWTQIVNMIRDNMNRFCEVASKSAVSEILTDIREKSGDINSAFAQKSADTLRANIEETVKKLAAVPD